MSTTDNYKLFDFLNIISMSHIYILWRWEQEFEFLNQLVVTGLCIRKDGGYFLTFKGLWVLHGLRDKGYNTRMEA
jgi:hypothetical protein